jgi:hypothetical protein
MAQATILAAVKFSGSRSRPSADRGRIGSQLLPMNVWANPAYSASVCTRNPRRAPWAYLAHEMLLSQLIKMVAETVMSVFAVFEARDLPRLRFHR